MVESITQIEKKLTVAREIRFIKQPRIIFSNKEQADEVFNMLYLRYADSKLMLLIKIVSPNKLICYFTETETAETFKTGELFYRDEDLIQFKNEKGKDDFIELYTVYSSVQSEDSMLYERSMHWQKNSLLNIIGYRLIA